MDLKRGVVSAAVFFLLIAASPQAPVSYWVGIRFSPGRCVSIQEGIFRAKRKLCTITYDIRMENGLYRVDGRIVFNRNYVPPTAERVELQVLLIDESFTCRTQMNLRSVVENRRADFSFVTENIPTHRYVKTYYVIHYR
jgi:hypothetical protein